ncbi:MAG: leucine-rich repeat domain-containing protein [Promethearchaeota archaeon]
MSKEEDIKPEQAKAYDELKLWVCERKYGVISYKPDRHRFKSIISKGYVKEIYISYSGITKLPESIGALSSLEILHIKGTLAFNGVLETLPETIGKLKNLKVLDLEYNPSLTSLPDSIGNLKSLERLNMRYNGLMSLPDSFSELTSLRYIDLERNKLNKLPKTIGNLKNLNYFNISRNKLAFLPNSFRLLKSLETFKFSSNPWNEEFTALMSKDITHLQDYLRGIDDINIFISFSLEDYDSYHIEDLAKFIENQDEINKVYYRKKNLESSDFFKENIVKSNLLLFIATENSLKEKSLCIDEIKEVQQKGIHIIPIKSKNVSWDELEKIGLSKILGQEFVFKKFDDFCGNLYNYIKKYKRDINLYKKYENSLGDLNFKIKNYFNRFIDSEEFKQFLIENHENLADTLFYMRLALSRLESFKQIFNLFEGWKFHQNDFYSKS